MTKQMAIMRNVRFGLQERGGMALTFQAWTSENELSIQSVRIEDVEQFVKAYRCKDISTLDGMPVWVETNGLGSIVHLIGPAPIGVEK